MTKQEVDEWFASFGGHYVSPAITVEELYLVFTARMVLAVEPSPVICRTCEGAVTITLTDKSP